MFAISFHGHFSSNFIFLNHLQSNIFHAMKFKYLPTEVKHSLSSVSVAIESSLYVPEYPRPLQIQKFDINMPIELFFPRSLQQLRSIISIHHDYMYIQKRCDLLMVLSKLISTIIQYLFYFFRLNAITVYCPKWLHVGLFLCMYECGDGAGIVVDEDDDDDVLQC